jgi:hypothetical protein
MWIAFSPLTESIPQPQDIPLERKGRLRRTILDPHVPTQLKVPELNSCPGYFLAFRGPSQNSGLQKLIS